MKFTQSLKKNGAFRYVYAHGISASGRLLVLYKRKNDTEINYLGVTVGKKVGGAVIRNRVKRLVKESYRSMEGRIAAGYDLVVITRAAAGTKDITLEMITLSLKSLLVKQGLLR